MAVKENAIAPKLEDFGNISREKLLKFKKDTVKNCSCGKHQSKNKQTFRDNLLKGENHEIGNHGENAHGVHQFAKTL